MIKNNYVYSILVKKQSIIFKDWLKVINFYNNNQNDKLKDLDLIRNRFKSVVETSPNKKDLKLNTLMNQGKIKLYSGGCFE